MFVNPNWLNELKEWANEIKYKNIKNNNDKLIMLLLNSSYYDEKDLIDYINDTNLYNIFSKYNKCKCCNLIVLKEDNNNKCYYCNLVVCYNCNNQPRKINFCNNCI